MSPAVCCGQYLPSGECCASIYGTDRLVWEPDESEPTCPHHALPLICGEPDCGQRFAWKVRGGGPLFHFGHQVTFAHLLTVCGECGEPVYTRADRNEGWTHDGFGEYDMGQS